MSELKDCPKCLDNKWIKKGHDNKGKQRNIVGMHLKKDNVKEVVRNTESKAMTSVILKVGEPLIYYGEMATDIYRFIFKKRYCDDEM